MTEDSKPRMQYRSLPDGIEGISALHQFHAFLRALGIFFICVCILV